MLSAAAPHSVCSKMTCHRLSSWEQVLIPAGKCACCSSRSLCDLSTVMQHALCNPLAKEMCLLAALTMVAAAPNSLWSEMTCHMLPLHSRFTNCRSHTTMNDSDGCNRACSSGFLMSLNCFLHTCSLLLLHILSAAI